MKAAQKLAKIDDMIDYLAWIRLLDLRSYEIGLSDRMELTGDQFAGVPPEALAEFPPAWVAAARAGQYVLPREGA